MEDVYFNHRTQDEHGYLAPLQLIGKSYRHSGNDHVYTITGVAWLGDTDEWSIKHMRENSSVECVRSFNNFFGNRSNGDLRFFPYEMNMQSAG